MAKRTVNRETGTPRRKRPSRKQDAIEQTLRREIVGGVFVPGGRLPLRRQLERRFKAGPVTVQKALDHLSEAGFVQSRGRRGTFVTDHPPHLSCYGLVFPKALGSADWNRFWTALSAEAKLLEQVSPQIRISIYHGIELRLESKDYKPLLEAVESDRLAGLIFPGWPAFAEGTPLMKHGLPRVAVATEYRWPGISSLALDGRRLIDRALEYFQSRGRRRVAVISMPLFAECYESHIISASHARGMISHTCWVQGLIPAHSKCVQNCAHLLGLATQPEKPDALLIADDNLTEPATAGLVAAGVRVPEDCEIISHANFPYPTPAHLPVKRLGYDIRQLLRQCLASIDRQRRGDVQPTVTQVPAVFDEEVPGFEETAAVTDHSMSSAIPTFI